MSSISAPFISRPIGVTLMSIGVVLLGIAAYLSLPVATLPTLDSPVIVVYAARPGADPETMAASVAAPLERALGAIAGVNDMTSKSTRGFTSIILAFDLTRTSDKASRDVQAALNDAFPDLPSDLPYRPRFYKTNPAAAPVLLLALTSNVLTAGELYDAADSIVLQRISQVPGVGRAFILGGEQPAIRVQVDLARLSAMGIPLDGVRSAIVGTNGPSALGAFDGPRGHIPIAMKDQLTALEDYRKLVISQANGTVVHLGDVADVSLSVRDARTAAWYNGKSAVIVQIAKKPDANVIETVEAIKATLPEFQLLIPPSIDIAVFIDRTATIRASIREIQKAALISAFLVVFVVFIFLRRAGPTLAAAVTVPLSLCGTFCMMWLLDYSINITSLLALTVSVGFMVDDAVVMIENVDRNIERGMRRRDAALAGARQIGFTIVSISISLIVAFFPLMFLEGVTGKVMQQFSVTVAAAVAISAFVSLTITPMVLALFPEGRGSVSKWFGDPIVSLERWYARSIDLALDRPVLMAVITLACIGAAVHLFVSLPKGAMPDNDAGFFSVTTEATPSISFPAMADLTRRAADIARADPAVSDVAAFCTGSNLGEMYIFLKPPAQRGDASSVQIMSRLRKAFAELPGMMVFLRPAREYPSGARPGKSTYQFTLLDQDVEELDLWTTNIANRLKQVPELIDVSTDRNRGGLQAMLQIDRSTATRLGVSIASIDDSLADAYSQRQVSILYGPRNQYRVVLEARPAQRGDANDLAQHYVPGKAAQIPLLSLATIERGSLPLAVNHQSAIPATTISYNVAPGVPVDDATRILIQAVADMHPPEGLRTEFAGEAKVFLREKSRQAFLIVLSLFIMYVVLGMLYESYIHPFTILSTLPSAGLGALITLRYTGIELNQLALIGIILLIGIVKKNGIMMVDFAVTAEQNGATARAAIRDACVHRFRPILMTTLTALVGAIPLVIATGPGAEFRQPLGVTIVGGLVLSQILTFYTTPSTYLVMTKLKQLIRSLTSTRRTAASEH
jgi:hydrophobe/amphiphile efflux-1 (HAE1) family protein